MHKKHKHSVAEKPASEKSAVKKKKPKPSAP
jgi:hypothetical protein